ncbi:3'-5' exonuclease [Sphingomonadaceae bacterium OTU29LAMAA1]|nr:3'-5' exonuclease [Sphingomonadaceae bacterium OTU29LAMAA1]
MEKSAAAGGMDASDVRVLHRVDLTEGPTGSGDVANTRVGVAVDVETTGKVLETGAIIELALRRFRFDADGVITHVDRSYCWREDPCFPIPEEIVSLTGITDGDVAGERIDDEVALRLLRSASIVVAHNAAFDRPWIERRLDGVADLDWACSMSQVDWRARGFDGLGLGYLLCQAGWFHDAHRGASDVDALIQLLRHEFDDGRTALSLLLERAARPSWILRAHGAAFEVKDVLRGRGYRWDAGRRVWWTEVADEGRTAEEFWLAANVYAAGKDARSMGPAFEEVSAATRFR